MPALAIADPQAVFQAALLWLWSALAGSSDVAIGSVTSGRTSSVPEVERIMGPCITSMPLRADLAGVQTVGDLIRYILASKRSIIQHPAPSLAEVKRIANILAGDSLYDLLFVFQESLDSEQQDQEQASIGQLSHLDILETPVLVEVEPRRSGFYCQITYHSKDLPASLVDIFLRQFDSILGALVRDAAAPLNTVREAFPFDLESIHNPHVKHHGGLQDLAAAVEEVAARNPAKPALHVARSIADTVKGDILTFKELNSMSNMMDSRSANSIQRRLANRHNDGKVDHALRLDSRHLEDRASVSPPSSRDPLLPGHRQLLSRPKFPSAWQTVPVRNPLEWCPGAFSMSSLSSFLGPFLRLPRTHPRRTPPCRSMVAVPPT